jgi:CubicO group peptidase (beta-lactamase class C family)
MTGGPATDWQGELRSWFAGRPAEHEFTGHAMAWRDGAPIFSHFGGLAHRGFGVAIDQDTRFATASVTKMATAIAALRLVDRGLLGLNAPLVDVLPPEHRPAALTREHTLHHLLSHTSGLANYHDDDDPTLTSWLANWDRIPTYHARRPADLLPLFIGLPADAPPGREVRYNDGAFVLAGLVIEAATGRPWDEVVAEDVFEPAGMTDTTLEAVDADPARLAVGYMTERGHAGPTQTNVFSITANPMPDGGMISTPADLCRLIDELEGGRLLSAELTAAMTRPQGPPSDEIEQWGYGCQLTMRDGDVLAIGHGGSDPGVSALVSHYRAAGTTVVVLCNSDRGAFATTMRIAAALGIDDPRRAWLPA